ncbi:MAG: histidine kinase [Bacteroidales bacterium]
MALFNERFREIVLIIILVVRSSFMFSQDNYLLKTYTSEDGLSYDHVQSICQDKTGFYWIATWDGLNRFDGYEFKNYYHIPGDSTSFPFFSLDKVIVDKLNNLWVFAEGRDGVIYNRAKDNFRFFQIEKSNKFGFSDIINGPDSMVWISFDKNLYRVDPGTLKYKTIGVECTESNGPLSKVHGSMLAFDNNNDLWLYFYDGPFYRFYKGSFKTDSTLLVTPAGIIDVRNYVSSGFRNTGISLDIYKTPDGNAWFFTKYGLYYYSLNRNVIEKAKTVPRPGSLSGKRYYTWAEEGKSVNVIDTRAKTFEIINTRENCFNETIFIDKFGTIWTGEINLTRENIGLNRYMRIPGYFTHYLTGRNPDNSTNLVFPIIKDRNGFLYTGTRNLDYVCRIAPDGSLKKIRFDTGNLDAAGFRAKCMMLDNDTLWIGSSQGQLFRYNVVTGEKTLEFGPGDEISGPESIAFHNILKSGSNLVINGGIGLYKYNPVTKVLSLVFKYRYPGTSFTLVKDDSDGYWLGFWASTVIHLDKDFKNTVEHSFFNESDIVEHVCPGDSSDIWVAVQGGGLSHIFPDSRKPEIFTTAMGLSNNVVYSILKDKNGYLWLSTNQGISMFNPKTRHFRNFGKTDGLLIREFNSDSYLQTTDGQMFFGGVGGMVGFRPDSIEKDQDELGIHSIRATTLKVSGSTRYFDKPVYDLDTIVLERGDNNFSMSFACFNIRNQDQTRFRYRLSGWNDNWIEADHRNMRISYAGLKHGKYQLQIESAIEGSNWGNRRNILIRIPERFFELFWVRLAIVLVAVTGLALAVFLYIQNLKFKARQEQDRLRLTSLRGQMNPHFIFNSLNSINYFISIEDKLSANNFIADFSRLIRAILDNMSHDYVPFEKEVESINDYLKLEHLRFGDKFDYSIDYSGISGRDEISVFPGLVQPFVENAIWHGVRALEDRKGHINVKFTHAGRLKIKCIISDDGVGREITASFSNGRQGRKPRGIKIASERLAILNRGSMTDYAIKIEDLYPDKKETGTRVIIDLPARLKSETEDD